MLTQSGNLHVAWRPRKRLESFIQRELTGVQPSTPPQTTLFSSSTIPIETSRMNQDTEAHYGVVPAHARQLRLRQTDTARGRTATRT